MFYSRVRAGARESRDRSVFESVGGLAEGVDGLVRCFGFDDVFA